jgi:hypothetical protein
MFRGLLHPTDRLAQQFIPVPQLQFLLDAGAIGVNCLGADMQHVGDPTGPRPRPIMANTSISRSLNLLTDCASFEVETLAWFPIKRCTLLGLR